MSNTRDRQELKKCVDVEKEISEEQARIAKESVEVEDIIRARLSEHLDGFIVIGFAATTGTPVITEHHDTPMTFLALNELLNRFYGNWNKEKDEDDEDREPWKPEA